MLRNIKCPFRAKHFVYLKMSRFRGTVDRDEDGSGAFFLARYDSRDTLYVNRFFLSPLCSALVPKRSFKKKASVPAHFCSRFNMADLDEDEFLETLNRRYGGNGILFIFNFYFNLTELSVQ